MAVARRGIERSLLSASALLLLGCNTSPAAPSCLSDPSLDKLVADLKGISDASPCRHDQTDAGACEMADLIFTPGKPRAESRGRRILVLDDGMVLAATARYPSRVLAQAQIGSDGSYEEYLPQVTLPKDALRIFSAIEQSPAFVSAGALQPLQESFLAGPGGRIPDKYWEGHGNPIFGFLAEAAPLAQFVVGQHGYPERWGSRVCELTSSEPAVADAALQELSARYDRFFASIQQLVERFEIDFINASWGLSRREAQALFNGLCGSLPADDRISQVLQIEATLMRRMGQMKVTGHASGQSLRDVITVQAATFNRDRALTEGDPDYPADCDSTIPNRLRAGSFFDLTTAIPPEGTSDMSYLDAAKANGRACTDAFINLGYDFGVPNDRDERARALQDTFFGIGWAQMAWPPTTSFAAPVALAHLIWLQGGQGGTLSAGDLLDAYTGGGARPVQDPVQNETFRGGDVRVHLVGSCRSPRVSPRGPVPPATGPASPQGQIRQAEPGGTSPARAVAAPCPSQPRFLR